MPKLPLPLSCPLLPRAHLIHRTTPLPPVIRAIRTPRIIRIAIIPTTRTARPSILPTIDRLVIILEERSNVHGSVEMSVVVWGDAVLDAGGREGHVGVILAAGGTHGAARVRIAAGAFGDVGAIVRAVAASAWVG
jgi:hypothetical protein